MEIPRDSPKPGVSVRLEKRRTDGPAHQLWYVDEKGFIRSKISDLALVGKETGEKIKTGQYSGDARQQWKLDGNRVVNAVFCNVCIGLKKGLVIVHDDADIIACDYQNKPYQHWRAEYI